jgi:aquaporin Z
VLEIALTGGLVSVILGTAPQAQNVGSTGALGVGAYIALAGLWAAPVSGTWMNPARSCGPALVSGADWPAYWVYVAGPVVGAIIAVGCAVILRGRGGDPTARVAASGKLGPTGPACDPAAVDRRGETVRVGFLWSCRGEITQSA